MNAFVRPRLHETVIRVPKTFATYATLSVRRVIYRGPYYYRFGRVVGGEAKRRRRGSITADVDGRARVVIIANAMNTRRREIETRATAI